MRTGNPALKSFEAYADAGPAALQDLMATTKSSTMTLRGTIFATSILIGLCASSAIAAFSSFERMLAEGSPQLLPWKIGSIVVAGLLGVVGTLMPKRAPIIAPIYAIAEGVALAALSLFISQRFLNKFDPTLVTQAVLATFGIAGGMLVAYSLRIIRIGGVAMKVMATAGIGLGLYSLVIIVCNGLLGMGLPNLFSSTSPLGIGFTVVCVVLASLFLVWDFQAVEEGINAGAPKYMEWYGGLAILITLAWLYIEVLRLIAKLRSSE